MSNDLNDFIVPKDLYHILASVLDYWGLDSQETVDTETFRYKWNDEEYKNSYFDADGMILSISDMKDHAEG
jgi:hypothetical protein